MALLQLNRKHTRVAGDTAGWAGLVSSTNKCLRALSAGEELREPPTLRSPITLIVKTAPLCFPGSKNGERQLFWNTRAYGTPGHEASIPGPVIRAKPGETLRITVKNRLEPPVPNCQETGASQSQNDMQWSHNGFCHVNFTNFHSHGFHVSPEKGSDDVFETAKPGEDLPVTLKIPSNHMPGIFWYHPHSHHSTSAQAGGGMHGALIIDDQPGLVPKYILDMPEKIMVLTLVDLRPEPNHVIDLQLQGIGGSGPQIEKWSLGNLWKDNDQYVMRQLIVYVLVNGMWQPRLTMQEGKWMRLRMVYATTVLTLTLNWLSQRNNGFECEFQLLAKDGVYLNEAPRTVKMLQLTPGSRSDVAMRCHCKERLLGKYCGGVLRSAAWLAGNGESYSDDLPELPREQDFKHSAQGAMHGVTEATLDQVLLSLRVQRSILPLRKALRKFIVPRPCYLVNLREATVPEVNKFQIVLPSPGTTFNNKSWAGLYYAKQGVTNPSDFTGKPMVHDKGFPPSAVLKVGNVYDMLLNGSAFGGGIATHSYHVHVTPFQIRQMQCLDGSWVGPAAASCQGDNYFEAGDWHDTLMMGGGQAYVRFLTDTFVGRYVMHCHILAHEDMGMMSYFEVEGKEGTLWPGSKKIDPQCYTCGEKAPKFKWAW